MIRSARKAYNHLKKIGCPVSEPTTNYLNSWGAQFYISAEDNHDTVWADYWEGPRLEQVLDDGTIEWAFGINPIIHRVLKQAKLRPEWINAGLIGVYQD